MLDFIFNIVSWFLDSPLIAKLILVGGLIGVYIFYRKWKEYENEAKTIEKKEIPEWRRKFM